MNRALKIGAMALTATLVAVGGAAAWHMRAKLPQREDTAQIKNMASSVNVAYDERGVPHLRAENEPDMYRALGYVHAQDRFFQMEMVRRLANGELAVILGPMAYLVGINPFQESHSVPLEFEVLGIPKRPFAAQDSFAFSGYLAFSFAAAFRTEPALTFVRNKLGPGYLRIFDLAWHPEGVVRPERLAKAGAPTSLGSSAADWHGLDQLAQVSSSAQEAVGVPMFEGSSAWAIADSRTASGKPLLAGDPHIAYSAPALWYEAHLSAPGFDLYGHYKDATRWHCWAITPSLVGA